MNMKLKWLTLEDIKDQLRLEQDYHDEDKKLKRYGAAAENTILRMCNRTYQDVLEEYGEVPVGLISASLMLVDTNYQYASPTAPQNLSIVPYGSIDILIKPYMRLASYEGGSDMQRVVKGSDVKIEFTADLPDGLKLSDVEFSGKIMNADATDEEKDFQKSDCIMVDEGVSYVVLVGTDELGVGVLTMKLTVQIPDTDYPTGYRREVININPHIQITG